MSDFMPSRWLSSDYEGNKEIVLDVYLNKNRDQEELRFRNLEEIFNYLNDLDEETWHQMQSLLKNIILHLEGHSKSAPEQLKKHQEKKRKQGETSCNGVCTKKMRVGFSVLFLGFVLCIIFFVFFRLHNKPSDGEVPHPCHTPPCPTDWFWYQGKCYYFSEGEKNWTSSQDFCFSNNASLARITKEETDFIHLLKGKDAFWIGLRRSPGQPWTWLNGDIATIDTAAITISIPSCLVICREVECLSQDSLIRSSIAGMKVGGSWRWRRLCLSGQ
uniref:Killer cell lectin-like receptor subfamily E member 1 n=1 Tax=Pogona vitticeps TaxID=103695 RepID=A0ABM5FIL3_9SAUR